VEGRALELGVVHVTEVFVSLLVLVVVRNEGVEEVLEGVVGVVATCIEADTRVDVLAPRQDHQLELHARLVAVPGILRKHLTGHVFGKQGLSARRELDESSDLFALLQVRTCLHLISITISHRGGISQRGLSLWNSKGTTLLSRFSFLGDSLRLLGYDWSRLGRSLSARK
jgi:hypothetical protein